MFSAAKQFALSKDARSDASQDACAFDAKRGLAAVADGTSGSLFSGSWARLLTEAAVANPPNVRDQSVLLPWLEECRQAWRKPIEVEKLAWHQKPKLKDGAAATLLWTRLIPIPEEQGGAPRSFRMYSYAIGDCVLFHVAGNQVQRAFPIENSAVFDAHPEVLRSVDHAREAFPEFFTLEDGCEAGDLLALCTDAFACWAITVLEAGGNPDFEACWSLSPATWRENILALREAGQIRADDTTLLLLRVGA